MAETAPEKPLGDSTHPTAIAIRRAAAELFRERTPASVTLREIAARAGVNFGLIHHYFRTKENLIGAVLADFSTEGGERISSSPTVHAALKTLIPPGVNSPYDQMLAWTVLDGSATMEFRPSAAYRGVRALISDLRQMAGNDSAHNDDEDRILTAAVMAAVHGWRFFRPYVSAAGELSDIDGERVANRLVDLLVLMIHAEVARPS